MPVQIVPFDYPDIGRQIRSRRKKLGLTQQQLAGQVPCSLTYISRIENGAKPSLEVLVRIAHIMDLSLDALFCVQAADDTELIRILKILSHQSPQVRHLSLTMLRAYLKTLESSSLDDRSSAVAEGAPESASTLLSDAPDEFG